MGAALMLEALGVPRETIAADYALTDLAADAIRRSRPAESEAYAVRLTPEVMQAILRADALYLDAAFAAIEARHGSVTGYFAEELDVTDAMVEEIRTLLLE
jgi:protein-tyrosine phosphatase